MISTIFDGFVLPSISLLVRMGVGVLDEINAISAPAKQELGLGLSLAKSRYLGYNFPYPLTLIPCPWSLFPYEIKRVQRSWQNWGKRPLSLIPDPLSLIPYPSSYIPYPISLIPWSIWSMWSEISWIPSWAKCLLICLSVCLSVCLWISRSLSCLRS